MQIHQPHLSCAAEGRRQELLNPWDKIIEPCTAMGHAVPLKMSAHRGRPALAREAAASLGTAQTHSSSPAGPGSGAGFAGAGGRQEPVGAAGEPREARGRSRVSMRGRGWHKAPCGRAAPVLPACFSAVPRRQSLGHLSRAQRGAAGRGLWRHFRAG